MKFDKFHFSITFISLGYLLNLVPILLSLKATYSLCLLTINNGLTFTSFLDVRSHLSCTDFSLYQYQQRIEGKRNEKNDGEPILAEVRLVGDQEQEERDKKPYSPW